MAYRDCVKLSDAYAEPSYKATCDYCGRMEDFDEKSGARAWLSGHILEEHKDELPDFSL